MLNTPVSLEITAQQSRFHVDAFETPASKEVWAFKHHDRSDARVDTDLYEQIDVKDLSITTGDRELLAHADLKLRENVHYVLVGRNGTGKSSENHFAVILFSQNLIFDRWTALLRALGEGRIPGVPWSLRILLLGQSSLVVNNDIMSDVAKIQIKECTVLEHVVHSDARQELALQEANSACFHLGREALFVHLLCTDRSFECPGQRRRCACCRQNCTTTETPASSTQISRDEGDRISEKWGQRKQGPQGPHLARDPSGCIRFVVSPWLA